MSRETLHSPERSTVHGYMECTPQKQELRQLFTDFETLFRYAPGSRGAHHFWYGGWMDHLQQMLDKYTADYEWLADRGWLDHLLPEERFDYADGLEVILVHDLEKPFKYAEYVQSALTTEAPPELLESLEHKHTRKAFREDLMDSYGIAFNPVQHNALHFIEGVRDDEYIPGQRVDKPLASLCHGADDMSGRIGYNVRGPYYAGEIEPVV